MSKSGTQPNKRKKRRRKKKPAATADMDMGGPSTVKKSLRSGASGGVMQGLRNGFKRAAGGGGDDDDPNEKPSTLSNVLWTVLLLGALGFLLYRWYG